MTGFQLQQRKTKPRILNEADRGAIVQRINLGESYRKIAQDYKISATHVGRIYRKSLEGQNG